jgi:hypothetical protein
MNWWSHPSLREISDLSSVSFIELSEKVEAQRYIREMIYILKYFKVLDDYEVLNSICVIAQQMTQYKFFY